MLVLSRSTGDVIEIGDATIEVVKIGTGRVRLGVTAPRQTPIYRGEVADELRRLAPESVQIMHAGRRLTVEF